MTIPKEEALGFWIRAREYFAYALTLLGQRERGLELLSRVLEQSTEGLTPPWDLGRHQTLTASVYLAAGRPEEARVEVRQGLAATTERNARAYRAPLLRLEARVLSEQASPELATALERLRESLALAAELGMRPEVAHCRLGLGEVDRRAAKRQEAREHLTTAAMMYREMDMSFWLARVEAEMARLG